MDMPCRASCKAEAADRFGLADCFAHDIAFSISALWDTLGFLAEMFEDLAAGSCLVLNSKKTVLIPLWRSPNLASVAERAAATQRLWASIQVALFGKYLGVFLVLRPTRMRRRSA